MRATLVLLAVVSLGGVARAQKPCDPQVDKACKVVPKKPAKPPAVPPTITVGGLNLRGTLRSALILQFLERADEELERASLERKSFVPALVRSIDDETL